MSPVGAWSELEWTAVTDVLRGYWPEWSEQVAGGQRVLWRRGLEQHRPEDVLAAIDSLRAGGLPYLDELDAEVWRLVADPDAGEDSVWPEATTHPPLWRRAR